MGKIFVNQTAIAFEATMGIDITGCTCLIKYKKPDGSLGSFPASIVDAENGIITASPESADDLDQVGRWSLWGYVTFANGESVAGEPMQQVLYEEGRYTP